MVAKGRLRNLVIALVSLVGLWSVLVLAACSKSQTGGVKYHCPMHPTYISDKPGDCPICGMRLVPMEPEKAHKAHDAHDAAATPPEPKASAPSAPDGGEDHNTSGVPGLVPIDVEPEGLQLAGVRTAPAERARIARTIRAVGIVRADESRIRHVHTKISGWVEKLFISFTGEPVAKGRPILSIYSQELLASQQEYLRAREAAQGMRNSNLELVRKAAEDMLTAARRRLELFDVPSSFIEELDRSGLPQRTVTLLAPVSGFVTGKQIFEGHQVEPGMELFTVSDLSRVWIEADVYENEANAVHVGQQALIVLPYDPTAPMEGKVKYIYPYLNPETRTLKVRFDFPNPNTKLRLDAFLNVEIPVESDEGVIVADSAIMDTGVRQVVFVNTRDGHFEPRQVKVGIRADGKAQILSGVAAGERLAIKANFLLDSESRLRAAIAGQAAESAR